MSLRCRYVQEVGRQGYYVAMWPRHSKDSDCPSGSIHSARRDVEGWNSQDCPSLDEGRGWDGACEKCGQPIPWKETEPCDCEPGCVGRPAVAVSSGSKPIFDTDDGKLHPGDMYVLTHPEGRWCPWDNCDGHHLHVVLPNGHDWDVDSRASNCTMKEDRTHRCWVREGEPPDVHVSKGGHTCAAGAGSIASGNYHGFLQRGSLTDG